ncbi:uncharacterized protein LOC142234516 [Haematobia irritans]|uniref:uncharacterized protein LOC142234516 n=1 Tax=Haematobia irritans TaxID=7368 RepID=UPI003F4F5720
MAFKYSIFITMLVAASAGYIGSSPTYYATPTYVTKQSNPSEEVEAQTQYSKLMHTPYTNLHKKEDIRNNNKAVTYSSPSIHQKTAVYSTPAAPKPVYHMPEIHEDQPDHVYNVPAPTASVYTQTVPDNSMYSPALIGYTHPTPGPTHYTYSSPATFGHYTPNSAATYQQESPSKSYIQESTASSYNHQNGGQHSLYHKETPSTTTYTHGPAASTYSHNGQGVSAYGSSQTVRYSPANMVSHMSFDGFGTHWGY